MTSDLTAFSHLKQNDLSQPETHQTSRIENPFDTDTVVFKKSTGMAFKVCKKSHANGIEHFNLLCAETGSSVYLSKFALEEDYTHEGAAFEKLGLRMVRRLSEMLTK
jgi:hypothetical protein